MNYGKVCVIQKMLECCHLAGTTAQCLVQIGVENEVENATTVVIKVLYDFLI